MAAPLQVDEIGERCRYRVHSEAKPQNVYLVDLLSNEGRGECTCTHFRTRVAPAIRDGTAPTDIMTPLDKHIEASRRYFFRQILLELAKREAEPATEQRRQR